MRDYAKQRPYSIKIRSDSAPSFPDHSNNSLPSKLPPGLQVPSSIPNLPRSNRLLVARPAPTIHGGTTNPCTRNGHPLFQDFAKYIIVKTVATPVRVPSREPKAPLFCLVHRWITSSPPNDYRIGVKGVALLSSSQYSRDDRSLDEYSPVQTIN